MTKEELKEYRGICLELRRLNDERIKWRARAEHSTRPPSLAPAIGGQHDPMPLIVDRLSEIKERMERLRSRKRDTARRIERFISKLPYNQKSVIRERYLEGRNWEDVAEYLAYDLRWVHRLHENALTAAVTARKTRHVKPHEKVL
jgi:DNA-directed RNA polymerase specialized sigma24 family protein